MIDLSSISARVGDSVTFTILNGFGLRHGANATRPAKLREWLARHGRLSRPAFFAGEGELEPIRDDAERLVWRSRVPSGFEQNDLARADVYLCERGWQAPTVFMLHALMSASDIGYRMWAAKFNRMGWNACFVHLPYHYSRRPARYWNGELAITCDIIRTAQALRQAVVDVRDLMTMLRAKGSPGFGLWSMSYGGWIGGLLVSLEGDFDFAVLMEPIVDVDHAVWRSPAGAALRFHLKRHGMRHADVVPAFEWLSPNHGTPVSRADRIYFAAGTHDRVAEACDIRALADQWGSPYMECAQGHIGYSLMPKAFDRLVTDGVLKPEPAEDALDLGSFAEG